MSMEPLVFVDDQKNSEINLEITALPVATLTTG